MIDEFIEGSCTAKTSRNTSTYELTTLSSTLPCITTVLHGKRTDMTASFEDTFWLCGFFDLVKIRNQETNTKCQPKAEHLDSARRAGGEKRIPLAYQTRPPNHQIAYQWGEMMDSDIGAASRPNLGGSSNMAECGTCPVLLRSYILPWRDLEYYGPVHGQIWSDFN